MKVPISENEIGVVVQSCSKRYFIFYRNGDRMFEIYSGMGKRLMKWSEFVKLYPYSDHSITFRSRDKS